MCKMGPFGVHPVLVAISLICLKAAYGQFLAFGTSAGDVDLLAAENNSTELQVESLPGFRISNSLYKSIFVSCIFRGRRKTCSVVQCPALLCDRRSAAVVWSRSAPLSSHVAPSGTPRPPHCRSLSLLPFGVAGLLRVYSTEPSLGRERPNKCRRDCCNHTMFSILNQR